MAAETVSAYPISFHKDHVSSYSISEHHMREVCEETVPEDENHLDLQNFTYNERSAIISKTNNELSNGGISDEMKENIARQITHHDIMNNGKRVAEAKKKRNVRKRNRCDMSPEELRRLRERERKAQQSRRDRIRAQKRQAQGWHDDDAAWEAFLDQTENTDSDKPQKKVSSKKQSSDLPSMVCNMSPKNSSTEEFVSDAPTTKLKESEIDANIDEDRKFQKQISTSNETDSNCGSNQDTQSMLYSSDENSMDASNKEFISNGKKISRRHFLPTDELERLRKRERDAKRKQRERTRLLANNDNFSVKEENDVSPNSNTEPQDNVIKSHHSASPELKRSEEQRNTNSHLSPKFHLMSPHQHHHPSNHHMHYPAVYMPDAPDHHHSPSSHYFRERHYPDMYLPRLHSEDQHGHKERDFHLPHNFHKSHHLSPHLYHPVHQPHSTIDRSISPEGRKSPDNSSPPSSAEKKRLISRNVDRKKLSEEELEDLRKRERDYQRERRARIRLEKAKSQANHSDQLYPNAQEDGMPRYYHSPLYQPHALHRNHDDLLPHVHRMEKLPHRVFPRYEGHDHYDGCKYSPSCVGSNSEDFNDDYIPSMHNEKSVLAVSIPSDKQYNKFTSSKDSELLQVVPKTRDYEDMKSQDFSPESEKMSPSSDSCSKKSVLENICSSLKKESPNWNGEIEDEDGDKLVIVQPNTEFENKDGTTNVDSLDNKESMKTDEINGHHKTLSTESIKSFEEKSREKLTSEQLERRRRSNREAQRRRRARLKMQNSSEDCTDLLNTSSESNEMKEKLKIPNGVHDESFSDSQLKGCRVKVTPSRPDSLYTEDVHSHHVHHRGKYDDHHIHEKYGRFNPEHLFHGKNRFYYPSPRSYKEMDEFHHFYHDAPGYHGDKYIHEYPIHHRHSHMHEDYKHSSRMYLDKYDNFHRVMDVARRDKKSYSMLFSPPLVKTEPDIEPMKQSGRKRKQCVPRKVISSASNTPEEDVDVCNISQSPKGKEVLVVPEKTEEDKQHLDITGDYLMEQSSENI